jgi:hypothetical protein
MSYANLQELKDSLLVVAQSRGLSNTDPVNLLYKNEDTAFEPIRFIVSYNEPYNDVAPLTVLWLVANPVSPNYLKLFRRTVRTPSSGYNHTWGELADLSTVWNTQIWDTPEPSDIETQEHSDTVGNPHNTTAKQVGALGQEGGDLYGPLTLRDLDVAPDDYADDEAVPRSWLDGALNAVKSVNTSIQQAFTNIFAQIDNLRGRVEILELSLLGLRGHIFNKPVAAAVWNVNHNMNNSNIMISVYENDQVVLPAMVEIIDGDNVKIAFAEPVSGKAEIVPIVEFY